MEIGVIILSGGLSSRFGEDKGLYVFKNKTLIEYSINMAKKFTQDIIIISSNKKYKQFGFPVYTDIHPGLGPMGGIHTGLKHSKHQINLVLSCDTPFINSELIDLLMSNYGKEDILISKTPDGKFQTLIGIYHKNILEPLENEISKNHLKMIEFIKEMNSTIIELSEKSDLKNCFINFNHLSQLDSYEH